MAASRCRVVETCRHVGVHACMLKCGCGRMEVCWISVCLLGYPGVDITDTEVKVSRHPGIKAQARRHEDIGRYLMESSWVSGDIQRTNRQGPNGDEKTATN